MTVGESIRLKLDEAGGEIITYYKIRSTGKYGIIRMYSYGEKGYKRESFMLNNMMKPVKSYELLDILMGFDSSEPKGSPYAIGNTDIMDDAVEITEEEFFSLSKADKDEVLKEIRELRC